VSPFGSVPRWVRSVSRLPSGSSTRVASAKFIDRTGVRREGRHPLQGIWDETSALHVTKPGALGQCGQRMHK
jgi:hypothetical protein